MEKEVVLSGIRATGKLHIGNYLGAIKQFVELAKDDTKRCFYFIANLHTLTTRQDPQQMQIDLRNIVLDFLACGLDAEAATIYAQSSVPEICELSWLLACLTPVNELMNMHHFREKRDNLANEGVSANAGLLTYPVLMAADILAPHGKWIPVGEDQEAHVFMARDVAKRFNSRFGETFPMPEVLHSSALRVPGLGADGKMGKSDPDHTINLDETLEEVGRKFRIAVTDPQRKRRIDPGNPQVCNIFKFHELLSTDDQVSEIINGCKTAEIGCVDCKKIVIDHVNAILAPINERREEILAKQGMDYIDEVIHQGGLTARAVIAPHVAEAKEKMGVPMY